MFTPPPEKILFPLRDKAKCCPGIVLGRRFFSFHLRRLKILRVLTIWRQDETLLVYGESQSRHFSEKKTLPKSVLMPKKIQNNKSFQRISARCFFFCVHCYRTTDNFVGFVSFFFCAILHFTAVDLVGFSFLITFLFFFSMSGNNCKQYKCVFKQIDCHANEGERKPSWRYCQKKKKIIFH